MLPTWCGSSPKRVGGHGGPLSCHTFPAGGLQGYLRLWAFFSAGHQAECYTGIIFSICLFRLIFKLFFHLFFMLCKARPDRRKRIERNTVNARFVVWFCCTVMRYELQVKLWVTINSFPPPYQRNTQKIRLSRALREKWGTLPEWMAFVGA